MKTCFLCGEIVKDEAIECPACKSVFDSSEEKAREKEEKIIKETSKKGNFSIKNTNDDKSFVDPTPSSILSTDNPSGVPASLPISSIKNYSEDYEDEKKVKINKSSNGIMFFVIILVILGGVLFYFFVPGKGNTKTVESFVYKFESVINNRDSEGFLELYPSFIKKDKTVKDASEMVMNIYEANNITISSISINSTENYSLDKAKKEFKELYGSGTRTIQDAKKVVCTINMTAELNGKTVSEKSEAEFVLIKYRGNWYFLNLIF